jgi:hypothetical protein
MASKSFKAVFLFSLLMGWSFSAPWAVAEWLECESLEHARSAESYDATPINIENSTSYSLDLYWIDFSGHPVYYATVHPGETLNQDTYFDHVWFVSYQKGFCRNAFSVDYGYEYFQLYE